MMERGNPMCRLGLEWCDICSLEACTIAFSNWFEPGWLEWWDEFVWTNVGQTSILQTSGGLF